MSKIDDYRNSLRIQSDQRAYLIENSNLPGPRGNLELARAAAYEIPSELLIEWAALDASAAPINTPLEFLTFCGVLGQGRLFLEGDYSALDRIKQAANDSRWRTREGAATALQIIGMNDFQTLSKFLPILAAGTLLEKRCAIAAICEPVLLKEPSAAKFALHLLNDITLNFANSDDRKDDGFIALKKGLAYGWSVATAASLLEGKLLMEKWLQSDDKDVRRVMQENLKKNRLIRMDENWINRWKKL
jgi:hypothetical protein